jgi:hypothetical protein
MAVAARGAGTDAQPDAPSVTAMLRRRENAVACRYSSAVRHASFATPSPVLAPRVASSADWHSGLSL